MELKPEIKTNSVKGFLVGALMAAVFIAVVFQFVKGVAFLADAASGGKAGNYVRWPFHV